VSNIRHLVVVLGDQLDRKSAAFDGFDAKRDRVFMAEVTAEAEHVRSHRARIVLFLAAMRHFRDELRARGLRVEYTELADSTLGAELARSVRALRPERTIVVEPGEWRVRQELLRAVPGLEIRPDRHFICSAEAFAAHAAGRRQLRMEFFYREMRRRTGVLMDGGQPAGGAWNFDASNRAAFGAAGPGEVPPPRSFPPDPLTRDVLDLVRQRFPGHPGDLRSFDWPVTRAQARQALADFVRHRLARFGVHQDAMWTGQPFLYHSRLSAALNLKLLDPRESIAAAEKAWRQGAAPIEAVEGFVRQVLGWREYVRGIYWLRMPAYLEGNALGADRPLPAFYWTGATEMVCLREAIGQTLSHGYAHHIQRLMVTGLYALLLGVDPKAVHAWYLAVYVDAVEWVELPNVLGMSQYADGGLMASKPYVASGRYIQRMSDYCRSCRFDPGQAAGERACPFTTLYWDFLRRHHADLRKNPRMLMQVRNLDRMEPAALEEIRRQAEALRAAVV
jgi:deoxyribodipyrimidine photolyase-related protein